MGSNKWFKNLLGDRKKSQLDNKSKGLDPSIIYNLFHELRSNLNGIIGVSELLTQNSQDFDRDRCKEILNSSNEHLGQIMDMFQSYLELSINGSNTDLCRINLRSYLTNLIERHEQNSEKKGLQFLKSIDKNLPTSAKLESKGLEKIIEIILEDCVQQTDAGKILFSVKSDENDNNHLQISIKDTSIGLPENQIDSLIDPDHTPGNLDLSRKDGSFKLAIAARYIRAINGDLNISSEWGFGTEYMISIPMIEPSFGEETVSEEPQEFHGIRADRILVADDNSVDLEIAGHFLKKLGAKPDLVSNGSEVIEALEKKTYDLIMMDIRMPIFNGIEATRYIRENFPESKQPKIVALSAYSGDSIKTTCSEAGMDDFLSKPVGFKDFKEMLKEWGFENESPETRLKMEELAFDINELISQLQGDHLIVKEVLDMSLLDAKKIIEALENALEEENYEQGASLSHRLIGIFSSIRAYEAEKISRQLEELCETKEVPELRLLLSRLNDEYDKIENGIAITSDLLSA